MSADQIFYGLLLWSETHTNRQATRHGWLPSLLGTGDTRIISVRWGKLFILSWLEQSRQSKNLLYRHGKPNEPTKEGPLSFVPIDFSFNSQQGPPLPILFGYDFFIFISILIILFKNPNHNSLFCRCYISLTWFRRGHYPSLETILLSNGFPSNTYLQWTPYQ